MIKEALHKVINNEDLTYEEALETMKEIMTGEASQIQMAAFLTALRMKGETITEITACAKGMRAVGTHLQPKKEALEIVGTVTKSEPLIFPQHQPLLSQQRESR